MYCLQQAFGCGFKRKSMELKDFNYHGVEYLVDKVIELGEKRFQIRTKDDKIFILTYNEIVHQWIVEPPAAL
jgi:hypothetical protein